MPLAPAEIPARSRLEESLSALRPHDHVCFIFDSDEEQHRANVPFVRLGLDHGDRCLCVADSGNVRDIEQALRAGGLDVDGAAARGALRVTTERTTYLARGAFDPEAMCGVVADAAASATRDGFRALRIAGEVTWALGSAAGADRVMEYEVRINELMPRIPALALCHYDRRRFSSEAIRDVIRTHPLALVRGKICRNLYYVPPGELVGPDRLHGEVDRLLENIYEREQAEEALRASERRLELVLEGAQQSFWDWDVSSNDLACDARWRELVGFDGRTPEAWRERIHPEDRAGAVAMLKGHLAGGSSAYATEYRVRFRDGVWHWLLVSGRVVERAPDGSPARVAGTWTDVTERRALQSRLELSSRLASVGTLAAGVAHEINNPLAFIDANLRWALEQLDAARAGDRDELRAALRDALDGATRVRDIVQDLRRFAQPGAAGLRVTADPGAAIEAAVGIARRQIQSRARLACELGPDLPPVGVGRHELGQIVVNLLVNAAQAIAEGRASENEVRVAARRDGDGLLLEVSDTGEGIAPSVLPRIFDPFFTTKDVGAGTGLGLAICHGIVQAAGGSITAHSERGRGATFRVRLPAVSPAEPEPAPASRTASTRRRVLVVDDEALVGRAITRTLGNEHDVEAITSGAEALRRLEAGERWDLILCDLSMPELTGMQLAELIEARVPGVLDRVVFMTGGAYTPRAEAFLSGGRRRFVEKPLALDVLRRLASQA